MNKTKRNNENRLEFRNPYQVYQLHIIADYCPRARFSPEVGRDLKALGFSLYDWHTTAQSVHFGILSDFWESFTPKNKKAAFCQLRRYISRYYGEAEERMAEEMAAVDRRAHIHLDEEGFDSL
jgi:hypothetical protein